MTIDFMVLLVPALIVVAVALIIASSRRQRLAQLQNKVEREWGGIPAREYEEGELDCIARYFENEKEKGNIAGGWIDDITWNDLEMDELFLVLNHTYSSVGQEYLYRMLRDVGTTKETLQEREALITYFKEHAEIRTAFQIKYAQIGRTRKISVSDYIKTLSGLQPESNLVHYLSIAIFAAAALLIPFQVVTGVLALIFAMFWNVYMYYKLKAKTEPYIVTFAYVMSMLRAGEDMLRLKDSFLEPYFQVLRDTQKKFKKFKKSSKWVAGGSKMSGSPLDAMMDYVRMIFHIDLIKFNQMLSEFRQNEKAIDRLTETLGLLEACIAVASFRTGLPFYAVPELVEYEAGQQAWLLQKDMYHPLIDDPVANTVEAKRGILVTGSNASGKSTFLKTVAVNAILAQTIHTCTAHTYSAPFFRIYSSMALRDDLGSKESYYIVEIKSLKRILNEIGTGRPVLCFVDEVLRGTNTVERIAASAQILKSLARKDTLCFAATHDIELTWLLESDYDNYHFQEEIEGQDVLFNYILQNGRATSRNAIRLLGMIGYEESIIADAQQTAEHFVETGEWKL